MLQQPDPDYKDKREIIASKESWHSTLPLAFIQP